MSTVSTATTFKSKRAVKPTIAGSAGLRPERQSRLSLRQAQSSASHSTAAEPSTLTAPAPCSSADESRIAALESALRQAVMELEEAAAVVRMDLKLSSTAALFHAAAQRKRELLESFHV